MASYPIHQLEDLPNRERAKRMLCLSDTRLDESWQAAFPKPFESLVDEVAARFSKGDDPGKEIGARRQTLWGCRSCLCPDRGG